MTFAAREESRDKGQPVSLYMFRYGPGAAYYGYTNAANPIVFGGEVYAPRPINNSEVVISGNLDRSTVDIMMPKDLEIAAMVGAYSSKRINCWIYQGHVEESDFRLEWVGKIIGRVINDDAATLTCEPASSLLRKIGLRRNWQYRCPHPLYGIGCYKPIAEVTSNATVQQLTKFKVTVNNGWDTHAAPEKYYGGVVRWTQPDGREEGRTIVKVSGAPGSWVLTLDAPTSGLSIGQTLLVAPGCDHQMPDCEDIHDNILNYGGQWEIPDRNPFGVVNNFQS